MSASVNILDGFTKAGKVDAVPGLYPEITFTYRPAGYRARCQLNAAAGEDARCQVVAKIIRKHLGTAQLVHPDGTAEAFVFTEAVLMDGTPSGVTETLLAYVMGSIGPSVEDDLGKSPAGSGSPS